MGDQPPPNYNPNDSMLNGGNDSAIMKVMGGGGLGGGLGGGEGTAPNGYNETQSLLSGGINIPIMKVEGGAIGDPENVGLNQDRLDEIQAEENSKKAMAEYYKKHGKEKREERKWEKRGEKNVVPYIGDLFKEEEIKAENTKHNEALVRIVKEFRKADDKEYNKFIGSLKRVLDKAINEIKRELLPLEKKLNYKKQKTIEISSVNTKSLGSYEAIKIIPLKTKNIIVLPPVKNPLDFFNMILFLKQNKFLTIKNNEFVLKKSCFVIVSSIDTKVKELEYFNLQMKLRNLNYEVMDDPYKLIYPLEPKPILFTNKVLNKPDDINDLEPTDIDTIIEENIQIMYYKNKSETYGGEFYKVQSGSSDTDPVSDDSFDITLNKYIYVIEVGAEDSHTITADIHGQLYRLRVPFTKSLDDKVYGSWVNGKYMYNEEELINDLDLQSINTFSSSKIADFLYNLTYFKCFNDTLLLTSGECQAMRTDLELIYKHILEKETTFVDPYAAPVLKRLPGKRMLPIGTSEFFYGPTAV